MLRDWKERDWKESIAQLHEPFDDTGGAVVEFLEWLGYGAESRRKA